MNKYLVGTCAFNEGQKILSVIEGFGDHALYDVLVVDDGSNDHSFESVKSHPQLSIIHNQENQGAGFCIRQIINHAKHKGYEAVFFVSGNNKDKPQDIYKLKDAIEEGFDLVQGSRYLPGGEAGGDMPLYRRIATKVYPFLFSLITRQRITDATNGFRAVRLSIFNDERIKIDQPWLDRYEMEPYILFQVLKLGYKVKEVPVTKIYPSRKIGYSKMKPFIGWWSIFRPLIFLSLGVRK